MVDLGIRGGDEFIGRLLVINLGTGGRVNRGHD
jgi:hypothetical protein